MINSTKSGMVFIAEDDDEDYILIKASLLEGGFYNDLYRCKDGETLCSNLFNQDKIKLNIALIIIDLNMPKKNGKEALLEIKNNPELSKIPVIIYTTSNMPEDYIICKELGANEYIVKPESFKDSVQIFKTIKEKWLLTKVN